MVTITIEVYNFSERMPALGMGVDIYSAPVGDWFPAVVVGFRDGVAILELGPDDRIAPEELGSIFPQWRIQQNELVPGDTSSFAIKGENESGIILPRKS